MQRYVVSCCCVVYIPDHKLFITAMKGVPIIHSLKVNTVFGGGIDLKFTFSQSVFSNIDSDIKIHEKNWLWVVSHEFSLFMGTIAHCY